MQGKKDFVGTGSQSDKIRTIMEWIESKLSSVKIENKISEQIYYINSYLQLDRPVPNLEEMVSNINSTILKKNRNKKEFRVSWEEDNTPPTEVASMLIPTYVGLLREGMVDEPVASEVRDAVVVSIDWLIENQFDKETGVNGGGWGLSEAIENGNIGAYIYTSYQAGWALMSFYKDGLQCDIDYEYKNVLQSLLECFRFFTSNAKPEITFSNTLSSAKSISWPQQAGEEESHSLATSYALEFLYYFYNFCQENKERIDDELIKIDEDLTKEGEEEHFKASENILNDHLIKIIWEKTLKSINFESKEPIKLGHYDTEPYSEAGGPETSYKDTSGRSCLIWICLTSEKAFPKTYSDEMKKALSKQIMELKDIKKRRHITDIQYIIDAVSDFLEDQDLQSHEESITIILNQIYKEILETKSETLENRKLLRELQETLIAKK